SLARSLNGGRADPRPRTVAPRFLSLLAIGLVCRPRACCSNDHERERNPSQQQPRQRLQQRLTPGAVLRADQQERGNRSVMPSLPDWSTSRPNIELGHVAHYIKMNATAVDGVRPGWLDEASPQLRACWIPRGELELSCHEDGLGMDGP